MDKEQLTHLCKCVFTLSRIPVFYFSNVTGEGFELFAAPQMQFSDEKLNNRLYKKYLKTVFSDNDDSSIGYYISDDMLGFGIVRDKESEYSVYVGPCRFAEIDKKTCKRMYEDNDIMSTSEDLEGLWSYLQRLPKLMPETLMWLLSFIDLAINHETLKPVTFFSGSPLFKNNEEVSDTLIEKLEFYATENSGMQADRFEKELVSLVKSGNIDGVKKLWSNAVTLPPNTSVVFGNDVLRSQKNNFIATITVVSRTAISAGVNANFAHTLKDTYLLRCESAKDFRTLANLYPSMLNSFTQAVQNILSSNPTGNFIVARAVSYITNHLTEKITAIDICKALGVSHGYLSTTFKKANGLTIPEYVNKQKIELAKNLLESTDKSLSDISNYLSFSSQSYFQSLFKKYEGCTPTEYKARAYSHQKKN